MPASTSAPGRRGVDMGPSAIRYAGLDERIMELGRRCEDWGDVVTAVAEATAVGDEHMRYLAEIKATCERIAALVARAVEEGSYRWCSAAITRLRSARSAGWLAPADRGGVLWLDAHGDLNRPETSPSGNVHGMPLAAALGLAGPEFESDEYPLPGRRARAGRAGRRPFARPGRAAPCWPSWRPACSR